MKEKIVKRYIIVYTLILVLTGLIFMQGFSVATLERGKWNELSEQVNATRPMVLRPDRGDICAEDGRILATSVPYYELYFDAVASHDTLFTRHIDSLSICLSRFFQDKSASEYRRKLTNARRRKLRYYQLGNRKVDHIELKQIQRFPLLRAGKNRGGLIAQKSDLRLQPHRDLACRTIGSLNKGSSNDVSGYVGLEEAFENYLKGEEGVGHLESMSGRRMLVVDKEPKHGCDVITTLNVDYQDVTQLALRNQLQRFDAQKGVAVVMEVKTGDVKAIANLERITEGVYRETMNFAISDIDEPGSLIKTASIMAILEDGYATPKDTFDLGDKGYYEFYGIRIYESDRKGMGRVPLQRILEKSSNGITDVVEKLYKHNPKQFVDRFFSMRLNEPLGIVIKGERSPLIKYPGDKTWSKITLPWMSFGYELLLSPLQILSFYNAIANGGQRMRPRFVKEIRDKNKVIERFDVEEVGNRICSRSTLKHINEMLTAVVKNGTAKNIYTPHYAIAGKTGTARVAHNNKGYGVGDYRASFVGYFPADNPLYSCIVIIEKPRHGYYGNVVAGKVFREIADQLYAANYITTDKPHYEPKSELPICMNGSKEDLTNIFDELDIDVKLNDYAEDSEWVTTSGFEDKYIQVAGRKVKENLMPNVKGMGLKDALYLLENMGLKVHVKGQGMIVEQSILPGEVIRDGYKAYLTLR